MACLCAPTTHAGSFRCRLHRGSQKKWTGSKVSSGSSDPPPTIPRPRLKETLRSNPGFDPPGSQKPAISDFGAASHSSPPIKKFRQKHAGLLQRPSQRPCRKVVTGPSRLSRMVVACADELSQQDPGTPLLKESIIEDDAAPSDNGLLRNTGAGRKVKIREHAEPMIKLKPRATTSKQSEASCRMMASKAGFPIVSGVH